MLNSSIKMILSSINLILNVDEKFLNGILR